MLDCELVLVRAVILAPLSTVLNVPTRLSELMVLKVGVCWMGFGVPAVPVMAGDFALWA
jgi:hypothetical protein